MGTIDCEPNFVELTPLHEKILYAEKHKKNYDIYFAVNYEQSLTRMELDQAIHYVFNAVEALNCVVVQKGSRYVFSTEHFRSDNDFRSATPLRNTKIDIFNQQLLAKYYIDEANHSVEFLIHHLVFDGDSLYELLDKIEMVVVRHEQLPIQEQKYAPPITDNPSIAVNDYRDQIESLPNKRRASVKLEEPFYDHQKVSGQATRAIQSLSQKLRVTKFGVLLFATAMLSHHKQNIVGIVVSRKDKRNQSQSIGNFTDVAPYLLQIDDKRSYIDNANIIFKQLFAAIEHSAALTYDQYMNMVGVRGYDCIVSYTKMNHIEQHSAIFSQLELGEYLYKYDNHFQFIEHKDNLDLEFRCDNLAMHHMYIHLEEMLLALDQMDLSALAQLHPTEQEDVPVVVAYEKKAVSHYSIDYLFPEYKDDMNIFDSNISSFDIAHIITDVYENLGVQLSYQDIYASHTIQELKQLITSKVDMNTLGKETNDGHVPNDYVCPNFIKAIFIDSFRFINSEMYNVKYAYRVSDDVSKQLHRLDHAINQVIQRNEVFFTKFEYVQGDVIGTITQPEKYEDIEQIEVETLADMNDLKSVLRMRGEQKLWDIRLIRVRTSNEIYLYINMHHILVDHIGMGILLNQIESNYHNKEVNYAQYRNIAGNYDMGKELDLEAWQSLVKHAAYPNQGKSAMGNGQFNLYERKCYLKDRTYEEMEGLLLSTITSRLANYFNCSQGYIGAVYHGRVVPKANQVISSFARVLPIFFDLQDEQVIQDSLRTARQHQAVSLYDLNESGFALEFPKVVFQTLYSSVNESSLFNHTVEFDGISKFQLFINLYVGTEECQLSIYIDTHLYSDEEEQIIISAVAEAIEHLNRSEGEEVYV